MKKGSDKTDWKRLDRKTDEDIDFSDIPETDASFWANAEQFMPKKKRSISIRLDEDIIEYFKSEGTGYQSRINSVLKSYMHRRDH